MFAAVGEPLARADDQVPDGAADEDLTGRGECADACADVDREPADVVVGEQLAFAGVQARANLQVQVTESNDGTSQNISVFERYDGTSTMSSGPLPATW